MHHGCVPPPRKEGGVSFLWECITTHHACGMKPGAKHLTILGPAHSIKCPCTPCPPPPPVVSSAAGAFQAADHWALPDCAGEVRSHGKGQRQEVSEQAQPHRRRGALLQAVAGRVRGGWQLLSSRSVLVLPSQNAQRAGPGASGWSRPGGLLARDHLNACASLSHFSLWPCNHAVRRAPSWRL